MYFLYAFYAGKAKLLNSNPEVEKTIEVNLFEPKFEAWAYGPVDREVYFQFKNNMNLEEIIKSFDVDVFEENLDEFTRGYLKDMTERIFLTSDFSLVDLSHDDKSWRNVFNEDDPRASIEINEKHIIDEYYEKELS